MASRSSSSGDGPPSGRPAERSRYAASQSAAPPAPQEDAVADNGANDGASVPGGALVIVESPTKAKTIGKYLGRGYTVKATVGHIRDLPPRKLGVDIENGFTPEYGTIKEKAKTLAE